MENFIPSLIAALAGIPRELIVFIISLLPILEVRGGLLAASLLGIDIWPAILICVIGNILPVPFILLLITPLFNWLKKRKKIRPLVEKLEARAMKKSDKIGKYQFWGLTAFVGIPLPGTGAWTGALIAAMLNIPLKKAVPATLLGIAIATVIMSIVSYGLIGAIIHS